MITYSNKKRLQDLADRIERTQQRLDDLQSERDDLITDLLLQKAASGTEIGRLARVSQPRTSQIVKHVMSKRAERAAQEERERRAQARRTKRALVTAAA